MPELARLQTLVSAFLAEQGSDYFLVDLNWHEGRHNRLVLQVDRLAGIQIDECMTLNRALHEYLEAQGITTSAIEVEVSSPGVGEPLKVPQQYRQNIGRTVRIKLQDGRELQGELRDYADTYLTIAPELAGQQKGQKSKKKAPPKGEPEAVPLDEIVSTQVQVAFH